MGSTQPTDPLWEKFKDLQPDVTLVLLPDDAASAARAPEPSAASYFDQGEAQALGLSLQRRVTMLADAWGVAVSPNLRWHTQAAELVRANVSCRAPLEDGTEWDPEIMARQLRQHGWDATIKHASPTLTIAGTCPNTSITVTVYDGLLIMRATTTDVHVTPDVASSLAGAQDD